MVLSALKKGLKIYGISEHHPRPPFLRYKTDPQGEIRGKIRFPEFLQEMDILKKEFAGKLELLKASEFDWCGKANLALWREWRAETDWDYVIGSVHFLAGWGFDYLQDWEEGRAKFSSLAEIYERYFAEVQSMIIEGQDFFQIVGHLDLIKKFIRPAPDLLKFVLPVLDALAETNLILEVSSAGFVKDCREQYPSLRILRAAREREIPLIFNSDAHEKTRIAQNFDELTEITRAAGYTSRIILRTGGERMVVSL